MPHGIWASIRRRSLPLSLVKKINFLGWYDRRNCGDEAFKLAFDVLFPGIEKVYTNNAVDLSCDAIVLGGGDVIKKMYLDYLGSLPFYIFGAGLGYESEIDLLKGKNIKGAVFRNFSDHVSAKKNLGIDSLFASDAVFAIDAPKHVPRKVPPGELKNLVVILTDAINPSFGQRDASSLAYGEYLKWELAKVIGDLSQWYNVTFVPFSDDTYDSDVRICLDVRSRMVDRGRCTVLKDAVSPIEAMDIIAKADLVMTMKFHGIIFSMLTGTPFVNIGLSRKTEKLCADNHVSELSVPTYALTYERVFKAVKWAEMDGVSEKLLRISSRTRQRLLDTAAVVRKKWFLNGENNK